MRGEAQEVGILEEFAAGGALILDNDALHLIEEELLGDAAEVLEGGLQALDDRGHRLLGVEAEPEESAVAEYDEEPEAFAPGRPAHGEIDLSLQSGRGLEAADGLWLRAGPDDRHIVAELGDAAGVPSGPDLLEEPDRTKLGVGRGS